MRVKDQGISSEYIMYRHRNHRIAHISPDLSPKMNHSSTAYSSSNSSSFRSSFSSSSSSPSVCTNNSSKFTVHQKKSTQINVCTSEKPSVPQKKKIIQSKLHSSEKPSRPQKKTRQRKLPSSPLFLHLQSSSPLQRFIKKLRDLAAMARRRSSLCSEKLSRTERHGHAPSTFGLGLSAYCTTNTCTPEAIAECIEFIKKSASSSSLSESL